MPVEWLGEALLLAALVTSPWIYGAVEDSVRYSLGAVALVGAILFAWPGLGRPMAGRSAVLAIALPLFGVLQVATGRSVAPVLTLEAALVAFSMTVVWASVHSRTGFASTNSSRRFAYALLAVCVAEAAFAAVQWSTDRRVLFGRRGDFQTMPFGSYVNHNNFAGLVSLGVPLAVALGLGDIRRSGRLTPRGLGLLGIGAALSIAVLASGSRGGALALVAGMIVLVVLTGRARREGKERRPRWLGPAIAGVTLLALAVWALPESGRARLASLGGTGGSIGYRVDIAKAAGRAFLERPFTGWGLGAFGDAVTPFKLGHGDVRSDRAEADLIEIAVEGGLTLVLGFGFVAVHLWTATTREMRHSRDRMGRWLRAGALAACATMVFHSLFDFGFRIPANAFAFCVLLGVATSASDDTPGGTKRARLTATALVGIAVIACGYRAVGGARERASLLRTTPEGRLSALQDLVDRHPYLTAARRQRGLAWLALAYSKGVYDPLRLERAKQDLEAVVAVRPQWGEAQADLGFVHYYAGNPQEALSRLKEATRLDPTHVGVGIAHAQVLAWTGRPAAAIDEIVRLRKANPGWSAASAREIASSWTQNPSILSRIP